MKLPCSSGLASYHSKYPFCDILFFIVSSHHTVSSCFDFLLIYSIYTQNSREANNCLRQHFVYIPYVMDITKMYTGKVAWSS
uniref:Uncharacterized protein n=1 Tax=Rhipicephalus appendiculatus TaxID=34631 RepID=A0A131YC04_RHIAP